VLRDALGSALIGVYLHGSAALGDYEPARSDIDILAVCAAPLGAGERAGLGARLGRDALPCPAGAAGLGARLGRDALPCPAGAGLEFSLVTRAAARDLRPAPAYELHGWDEDGRVGPGGERGDPDLPLHFAVVRQTGLVVCGPPPADVLREVPRDEQMRLVGDELDWAVGNASRSTQVLTACRAWALSVDGRFRSKRDAAGWALRQGAPPMVAEVLADHRAARESRPEPEAVAAFVASVRTRLQHK
jgi:aminoglycoside adenylyltransferase-like protein/nucleotidyltransferase-like protein